MRDLQDVKVRQSSWFTYLQEVLEKEDHVNDLILGALMFTPDFALHVLALANSPTFSASTPIERLDRAVFLLGRESVRDLAREVETIDPEVGDAWSPLSWSDFVHESVAVATGASLIARAAQIPLVEEARTAGLIHDMGFILLAGEDHEGVQSAWEAAEATGTRLVDHERLFCGNDHCSVAEELFVSSGLPDSLAVVAGLHHDPLVAPSEHRYLSVLVYAGECLAQKSGLQNCNSGKPALEDRVFAELRLDETVTSSYVPLLLSELEKLGLAPRTAALVRA